MVQNSASPQLCITHGTLLLFFSYFIGAVTYITIVNNRQIFTDISGMAFNQLATFAGMILASAGLFRAHSFSLRLLLVLSVCSALNRLCFLFLAVVLQCYTFSTLAGVLRVHLHNSSHMLKETTVCCGTLGFMVTVYSLVRTEANRNVYNKRPILQLVHQIIYTIKIKFATENLGIIEANNGLTLSSM